MKNLVFKIKNAIQVFALLLVMCYLSFDVVAISNSDLASYSSMNMNVYQNSRVTSIIENANGTITVSGYMFKDGVSCISSNSLYREIIFVNEYNTSVEYAYRQQVVSKYNTFLNNNAIASKNGSIRLDYANYEVTFNSNYIENYKKTSKGKMNDGYYLVYMRISDGQTSYSHIH